MSRKKKVEMLENRIRLVKVVGDVTEVQLERENDKGYHEQFSLRSGEQATAEFHKALQALTDHLRSVLDLGEYRGLRMCAVRISYKDSIPTITLVGERRIDGYKATAKFATPPGQFTEMAMKDIDELCRQAVLYYEGERAQLEIPFNADAADMATRTKVVPERQRRGARAGASAFN